MEPFLTIPKEKGPKGGPINIPNGITKEIDFFFYFTLMT
jgi:hypothetical protein